MGIHVPEYTIRPRFQKETNRLSAVQCAGWELNPHALRHMALNHACLPIPAPAQKQGYYNRPPADVKPGVSLVREKPLRDIECNDPK